MALDDSTLDPENKESILRTFFLSLVVISPAFLSALTLSYTTIALPQMNLSLDIISWFGSVNGIVAPFSAILCGIIIDKFGRKSALIFAILPSIAGWLFLMWDYNVLVILTGQILNGLTIGAVGYSSQVYAGECIMMNHVRLRSSYLMWDSLSGSLASMFIFSLALVFRYRQICAISAIIAVVLLIMLCLFIPESPVWLYRQGRIGDAEWSQKKLRITQPILKLVQDDSQEALQSNHSSGKRRFQEWLDKFARPDVRKPLLTFSIFCILYSFSGVSCVMTYMIQIFDATIYGYDQTSWTRPLLTGQPSWNDTLRDPDNKWSVLEPKESQNVTRLLINDDFNPYSYNLVSGILMIVSSILAAVGLPYLGLKKLLALSMLGFFVAMVTLSYTSTAIGGNMFSLRIVAVWIAVFFFSFSTTTPYAAAGDALPPDAKGFTSIVQLSGIISSAFIRKAFPYMCIAIGAYTYCIFALISILGAIYAYCFVTEVVGKTLDEINREYLVEDE